MACTRRNVIQGLVGVAGAVGAVALGWLPRWRRRTGPTPVDVLVVGGGVQGLAILDRLRERGYSAALVTSSPLGAGQTLRCHGILNSGYPFPDGQLRTALKRDWLPFARTRGLEVYGEDEFYILTPPDVLAKLRPAWNELGYEHEIATADRLPSQVQQSELLLPESNTEVVKITEYTFPKRQLIRVLSDGLTDRIIHGTIEHVQPATGSDVEASVGSVRIRPHGSSETIELQPRLVVTAAGAGTRKLIDTLLDDLLADAGEDRDARATRQEVQSQVEDVVCRKTHMICIRGPREALPAVNLFVLEHRLMIVTASVDHGHDRRAHAGADRITWYVTPLDPSAEAVSHAPDTARATIDSATVADGINKLLRVYPCFGATAAHPDSRVEFAVYAGFKQDIGEAKNRPFCTRLPGIENVLVALPSLVPGAFVSATEVMKAVELEVEPSGRQPSIPGSGSPPIGEVAENTDEVTWMSWNELVAQFPGIRV